MKQLGFDWDRAERDRWIDEADLLPDSMTARGSTVKRHWMVNLLRVLNGFVSASSPECWASQKTLAVKLGLRSPAEDPNSDRGVKTVQRTLDALEELSLVIVRRRVPPGGMKPVNHYRLVWSELMLLSSARRQLLFPSTHQKQQDFSHDQQDYPEEQQDFFGDQQDLKSSNLLTSSKSLKPSTPPTPQKGVPLGRPESPLGTQQQKQDLKTDPELANRLIAECIRLEVHDAPALLSRAAKRVGWQYLAQLLEHFRAHPGAWGVGALRIRIDASWPGVAIDEGWQKPREIPKPTQKSRQCSIVLSPESYPARKAEATAIAEAEPSLADQVRKLRGW